MTYEQLQARVAAWAATQPSIRAVIMIGSQARGNADQWSDLDVLIFTSDAAKYGNDPGWLGELGEVWVTYAEPTAWGDPEWYAVYAGGVKMDAVLMQVTDDGRTLDELVTPFDDWDAFRRGATVLYDRDGAPRPLASKAPRAQEPPTAAAFENVINGVLMASLTTAKFTARGDLWRAQRWFANDLHVHLLRLMEWQAFGQDTWYGGRFMGAWADERAVAALPSVFPSYDKDSMARAILAVLELARRLGEDVAARFGFVYPAEPHEKIRGLVNKVLPPKDA